MTRDYSLTWLTTDTFGELVDSGRPVVALVPVGSVEPHGPHLTLLTDTIISKGVAQVAADRLLAEGIEPLVAPAVPYGVTECAGRFAGAVSIPARALTAYLRAVIDALLAQRVTHVCLVNNHLEPAHDGAVRAAAAGRPPGRVSVACPLSRRWARTLTDEFRSGACHAGRYETSLVLALEPDGVDDAIRSELPEVRVSLSEQLRAGVTDFVDMGLDRAYAGAPAAASAAEGRETLDALATMVVTEVLEALEELGVRTGDRDE
ncbi:MAG: creatininase family protein [Deltaproteobacteria bacterium]|nr:MAG: creatininase family protein [Deltaproteobacteria bacterium]